MGNCAAGKISKKSKDKKVIFSDICNKVEKSG